MLKIRDAKLQNVEPSQAVKFYVQKPQIEHNIYTVQQTNKRLNYLDSNT